MIVINAEGTRDVRRLRRLAESLDATDVPDLPQAAPAKRSAGSGVSILSSATVSPSTQEAILALEPTVLVVGSEYEDG